MVSDRYEKRYMEDNLKSAEQVKDDKSTESPIVGMGSKSEGKETKLQSKTSASSATEQDLDVFLLGDLGDSDENPGMISSICLLKQYIYGYFVKGLGPLAHPNCDFFVVFLHSDFVFPIVMPQDCSSFFTAYDY